MKRETVPSQTSTCCTGTWWIFEMLSPSVQRTRVDPRGLPSHLHPLLGFQHCFPCTHVTFLGDSIVKPSPQPWRRVLRLSRMKTSPKSWINPLAWKRCLQMHVVQTRRFIFRTALYLFCRYLVARDPSSCGRYTIYEYWYSLFDT